MPTGVADDLQVTLAAARRPLPRSRAPRVDLGLRLRTTPLLHGLLPASVEVRRALRRGRGNWQRTSQARERARGAMRAIVAGTERGDEIEQLARLHVIESEVQRTLFWRPWRAAIDAASLARVRDACADGNGALLSICHLGPFFHAAIIGPALGRTVYTVGGPWCFVPPTPDYWGRRLVRRLEGLRKQDGRMVRSTGSFGVLRALLEEGELVLMHFDVPGSRRTRFLGKPAMLTTGSARLAALTGAAIVPIRVRRVGRRVLIDAAAPLDPRRHDGVEHLHEALAAVHERWILESPDAFEDPGRAGFWETGATAQAWSLPARAGATHEALR